MPIDNGIIARFILFLSRPHMMNGLDPFSSGSLYIQCRLYANHLHCDYVLLNSSNYLPELWNRSESAVETCNELIKFFTARYTDLQYLVKPPVITVMSAPDDWCRLTTHCVCSQCRCTHKSSEHLLLLFILFATYLVTRKALFKNLKGCAAIGMPPVTCYALDKPDHENYFVWPDSLPDS